MERYQVFMTQNATQGLKHIAAYIAYELKEPSLAKKLVEEIQISVNSLTKLPLRYALVSDESLAIQGFRKIMLDNYLIFYIVSEKDKTVAIIRILDGRRDWIHLL
jgi:addiction module RelE/StbE family toxin